MMLAAYRDHFGIELTRLPATPGGSDGLTVEGAPAPKNRLSR